MLSIVTDLMTSAFGELLGGLILYIVIHKIEAK